MALEVQVYREVRGYQAKVLFGLSWRQLLITAIAAPFIFGSYFLLYLAGFESLAVYVVVVLSMPAVAFGWWRPQGLAFEKYVGYWWAHHMARKIFVYDQKEMSEENAGKGKEKARARGRVGGFEAEN